jgi:hypothetical protein
MTSSEIIRRVLDAINLAEITNSPYEYMEARRLLANDLPTAIAAETTLYPQHTPEVAICQNLTPGVSVSPAYEMSFLPDGTVQVVRLGGES